MGEMIIMLFIILVFFGFMYMDLLNDDTMPLNEKYYYCGMACCFACLPVSFSQSFMLKAIILCFCALGILSVLFDDLD